MRPLVVLLLALALAPIAGPIAHAGQPARGEHDCCPPPAEGAASTVPCQYLAPLGCCSQQALPASASADPPAARLQAGASLAPDPIAPPHGAERAHPWRAEHGPPQSPYLRTIVLQL